LGIGDTGADLFGSDLIVARDFIFRLALRDKTQNEFHGESCSADNWFANYNDRIGRNVILPSHRDWILPSQSSLVSH
jgi:hypothetical protein